MLELDARESRFCSTTRLACGGWAKKRVDFDFGLFLPSQVLPDTYGKRYAIDRVDSLRCFVTNNPARRGIRLSRLANLNRFGRKLRLAVWEFRGLRKR